MKRFMVLIIGIIFIAVGGFLFYKSKYLEKNCTVEATATVVDMKQEFSTDSDSNTSYIYYPIIEYSVNDNIVRATMDKGSNVPAYDIDEKITILYNPNKTNEFIVKGDKSSNIFSIVFMALGVLISGFGIKEALKKE